MAETLLGLSEVLLFGREVDDLQIPDRPTDHEARVATTDELAAFSGLGPIDEIPLAVNDTVLVHLQKDKTENGLYTVKFDAADPTVPWDKQAGVVVQKNIVKVTEGELHHDTFWQQKKPLGPGKQRFQEVPRRGGRGRGRNNQLDDQLGGDAQFARIYGFSYEGTYYELPNPTLFLVHGEGERATSTDVNILNQPADHASRAPFEPSLSGVGAADFQIADNIRVWNYDKADYTIRMDVATGMIEQVLLDIFFEVEAPMLAGGRVAGGRVAGGRVAGGRVAGGRVAGGRVSGGRVGGSSD